LNPLKEYYKKRIKEYEEIYHRSDPIRLKELDSISESLKKLMKDKTVLEIASGTGYWTQIISETAFKIIATDYINEILEFAKLKKYNCGIEFKLENAYDLSFKNNEFEAGVANFWFSHISRDRINLFLNEFHRVLKNNAIGFFADNIFNEAIGGLFIKTNEDLNSYKLRKLKDGSEYKIVKNYYNKEELYELFSKYDENFSESNIYYGKCFWYVYYNLNP